MASYATRAVALVLMLAVALCFGTTRCTAASYEMIAGVSGTSYFWTVVSELMASSTTVAQQINDAIQDDLQTAAGSDVTVAYTDMLINASAMYLKYDATVTGTSPTEAELRASVAADATFPKLTAAITGLSGTTDISDLIPTSLSVTSPLYEDPAAAGTTSGYTIVSSVNYALVVLFSGTPSAWTTTLASDRSTVSSDIVAAVQALMDSSKLRNAVTVSSMDVLAADADKKTMGSGAGGLLVRLSIVSSSTVAMTGRMLSTSEYASGLLSLDTATLTATFQASSGSSATVVVEETTSAAALGESDKCDGACKGMIAMAVVIAVLSAVCIAIAVVAIACPCGIVRSPRSEQNPTPNERYVVQTEVAEAVNVYSDEEAAESHAPTTLAASPRENNEPATKHY